MKSIATRKKAIEIRLWARSSSGMPDSMAVSLTRPPVCVPRSHEIVRMAVPSRIAIPRIKSTGKYCSGKVRPPGSFRLERSSLLRNAETDRLPGASRGVRRGRAVAPARSLHHSRAKTGDPGSSPGS
jgi:hypothetical protein